MLSMFLVVPAMLANQEIDVAFESDGPAVKTIDLPYGKIFLKLVDNYRSRKVIVSIENTSPTRALLIFDQTQGEKALKKHKPKVEFEKYYPGSRGSRDVLGCPGLRMPFIPIVPAKKIEIMTVDMPASSNAWIELPLYLANFDAGKLLKKNPFGIKYKIESEDILHLDIRYQPWTESDAEYQRTKARVEEFINTVNNVKFCKNTKHEPSLEEQQRPYYEQRDQLVNAINHKLYLHPEWFAMDAPHIQYSRLLTMLKEMDLDKKLYDCGKHRSGAKTKVPAATCTYCKLSAREIYHQLDDIYKQLRVGKLSKETALKRAQALYNCYFSHPNRGKDADYSDKIKKFYNRITGY